MKQTLHCFLPEFSAAQVLQLITGRGTGQQWETIQPGLNWQQLFCQLAGLPQDAMVWSKIRLSAFDADKDVAFACCLDPVLVHTTHRGVYLFGQENLQLNQQQALQIVASINETLMEKGEQILMLDPMRWLYTSHQPRELISPDWRELIGTDLFKFGYTGADAGFWRKLSNEIQMLIHQLIDYKKLLAVPPQHLVSVHCWQGIAQPHAEPLPFAQKEITLYADDTEMLQLCCQSVIKQKPLSMLANPEQSEVFSEPSAIYFGAQDAATAETLLPGLIRAASNCERRIEFICADQRVRAKTRSIAERLGRLLHLNWFRSDSL